MPIWKTWLKNKTKRMTKSDIAGFINYADFEKKN